MTAVFAMKHIGRAVLATILLLAFALALAVAMPRTASAYTCSSQWCSGSDSSTAYNIQGKSPQIYIGEVDTYKRDFYGVAGPCPGLGQWADMCWDPTGANGAATRYNDGTGIGVEAYYFGGGPGVNNQGVSALCFGAEQGYNAAVAMTNEFDSWMGVQFMMAIDVEDPIADYGWETTEPSADRNVFNGFWDYTADEEPCGEAYSPDFSQPIVYSAPAAWCGYASDNSGNGCGSTGAMGSGYNSIPNTPEWSYEECCEDSWLGSNWGGLFWSFGGTSYRWALQFDQNPDYNDAYEPQYMPVWGFYLGS